MRICFVSRRFFPTISGMSVYALNLLRELVAMGHDVVMVSQYRGDTLGTRVYGGGPPPAVPGVKIIGLESVGEQNNGDFEHDIAAMVNAIVAEHERQPFEIIHAQYGYPTGLAALEASNILGVPNLVSIQGGDGHWVGTCCATHKAAMLAVLGHAGALLIGSRSFAEEVHHNHSTPIERFTIVPGAVDVGRFKPRPNWRAGEVIEDGQVTLLYHGRVDRRKGVLDLVDAMAMLRDNQQLTVEGSNTTVVRLLISGIGPDSDAAAERVRELGLENSITLTGYADYETVPEVYRRGDIFVSPTYAEGFSNTILEAMASGLPIVSCDAVGVVDCLRDDDNALLVPPADISALANAIKRMLDNKQLRARLAQRAYDEVQDQYAWPTIARQIASVYKALHGTSPDTNWSMDGVGVAECRFRAQPHLL